VQLAELESVVLSCGVRVLVCVCDVELVTVRVSDTEHEEVGANVLVGVLVAVLVAVLDAEDVGVSVLLAWDLLRVKILEGVAVKVGDRVLVKLQVTVVLRRADIVSVGVVVGISEQLCVCEPLCVGRVAV